ncbi:hypothetical protein TNCV_4685391 [Trichonephila clavipes]|nr:hypothetical protein TNCV_4685391 [Trichonephila clavipes]
MCERNVRYDTTCMERKLLSPHPSGVDESDPKTNQKEAYLETEVKMFSYRIVTSLLRNINSGRLLCEPDTHTCILQLQRNPCLTPEESSPSTGR